MHAPLIAVASLTFRSAYAQAQRQRCHQAASESELQKTLFGQSRDPLNEAN